MRNRVLALLAAAGIAACGDAATIEGVLADDVAATEVWVVGRDGRDSIVDGAFAVRGVPPGVVDLRFGDGSEEIGVVRLDAVPRRTTVTLSNLRRVPGDQRLMPDSVRTRPAAITVVNGIRVGRSPFAVEDTVDVRATLLAAHAAGRVLLRPLDETWPDLEAAIVEDGEIRDGADRSIGVRDLVAGDTLTAKLHALHANAHGALSIELERVVPLPPPPPRIVPLPPDRPRILGEPAPRTGRRGPPPHSRGRGRGPG